MPAIARLALLALPLVAAAAPPPAPTIARASAPTVCEAVWTDAARGRAIPIRLRLPEGSGRVPLVVFSHGLGGSIEAGTGWATHWVAGGLAVVHVQHPGSDLAAVRRVGLQGAMTGAELEARAADVRFVLDRVARGGREGACDLARVDASRVGMSGHSYGAHTTQALAGQRYPGRGDATPARDPRIVAAIAFSPAPPQASDAVRRAAFAAITIPFLSVTGTADASPVLPGVTAEDRTLPFAYVPPGDKGLLVLAGANHAAFAGTAPREGRGRAGAGARAGGRFGGRLAERFGRRGGARQGAREGDAGGPATPEQVALVQAVTLDFWRAHLLGDRAARERLRPEAVRPRLGAGDEYRAK